MGIAVPSTKGPRGFVGRFTTEAITLPPGKRWDILDIDGTSPENTTISMTILDAIGKPIDGYRNLESRNVDLSTLSHRTIQVKVEIISWSNDTTPTLDRLLVNWMDEWEWREQFYGEAKFAGSQGLGVTEDELQRSEEVGGPASGSYLSKAFGPEVTRNASLFHTLRYTARLGSSQSGRIRLVDSLTSDVLAETPLDSGTNEWDLRDAFSLKEHPSIQVNITAEGLDVSGEFAVDDLWVNWTPRLNLPPVVIDIWPSEPTVERTKSVDLYVNVSDEYDDVEDLKVVVQHRLQGEHVWRTSIINPGVKERCEDGHWAFTITPRFDTDLGLYTFRANVTDVDGGYSDFLESSATLEVLPNLPSAPTDLHATPKDSVVELEWREPRDSGDSLMLGYRVYRGLTNDSLDFLASVGSFYVSYKDEDVENGVVYYYAVMAYSELGDGDLSEVVKAMPAGPPGAPLGLAAEAGDEQVTLSWSAPERNGGYPVDLYHIHMGPTEHQLEKVATSTGLEFTLTGLVNGRSYNFAVSAQNGLGEGPVCQAIECIPSTLPDAPRELSATPGTDEVTLSWFSPLETGGLPITGFVIWRGGEPDGLERLAEVEASPSLYTDTDVVGGVTYHYAVSAVNPLGEGPRSATVSVMPVGLPGAPVDLAVVPGDGQVTLTWTAPGRDGGSPVTSYVIIRGTSPGDMTMLTQVMDTLTYTDTEVANGQTYHYAVAAVNGVGEGVLTDAVEATPLRNPTVPGRLASLEAKAKGAKVELTWEPPEDDGGRLLTGYVVLRGSSADDMVVVATLGLVKSWTDDGVKRGRTYHYSVAALNDQGQGEPFEALVVKVPKKVDSPAFGVMLTVCAIALVVYAIGRRRC